MLVDSRLWVHSLCRANMPKRGIVGRVGELLRSWIRARIVADEMEVIAR